MRKNGVMTNGKFEGIMHIANSKCQFTMVATDQRGSLKRMLNPEDPSSVTPEQMKKAKMTLIKNLVGKDSKGRASGVLIDPEYSYEKSFIKACNIRADVGILMSVEASGYGGQGEFAPQVKIFDGLNVDEAVRRIKNRGAAAVKMLVYYRPDSPTRDFQELMIKTVGRACVKYDIPFLLEPMSHSLKGGPHKKKEPKKFAEIKPNIVIETARELTKPEYSVDVLKAEFPTDLKYAKEIGQDPFELCKELNEASQVPWVLLSAGVDFEEFREQLKYAVKAGASGFLCGRAIWKESVKAPNMDEFLSTIGVKRLNEIISIVEEKATPWYKKFVDSLSDIELERGE
ncbi:TPA: tagatose 1,6-diphosphate aldolase [Candidatus Bathyarchaeota archaeon]|nr:tagatose 1,6-diphosphate aldolase [Candidatus Bathyarchaeota archaeon]